MTENNLLKQQFLSFLDTAENRYQFLIIMGMPKSGTTLPLTLLDNHPELIVFPEELRFFHLHCDVPDGDEAFNALFSNANIEKLKDKKKNYAHYGEHGGTGFGKRDYSNIDYDLFREAVGWAFHHSQTPKIRYISIFLALELAKTGNMEDIQNDHRRILVSKAPDNDLFLFRWNKMVGDQGKYLMMVRNPYELYISLSNVQYYDQGDTPEKFAETYGSRLRMLGLAKLPESQLHIMRYEDLIQQPELCMTELANFVGIAFDEGLLKPTKNGVPWGGNSSRGIQRDDIFSNPEQARELLTPQQIEFISHPLSEVIQILGYELLTAHATSEE